MGVCVSTNSSAVGDSSNREVSLNRKLSKDQAQAKLDVDRSVKLLILGAGDSGKTTWRKQIMNLFTSSFSTSSVRRDMANVVVANVMQGAQAICRAGASMGVVWEEGDEKNSVEVLMSTTENSALNADLAKAIALLMMSEQFMGVYERRSEYQLQDCWKGFADCVGNFPEWGGPTWVPTIEECVRARIRTSGIIEEAFKYKGVEFKLYDAGGQRAERRKWIHCFDSVTAVIFVAASSEYDQNLFEDHKVNRLTEAISLFNDTCNSKWFVNTPMLLFLNKKDLFIQKFNVKRVPLNVSGNFPTAPENFDDVDGALQWIADQFTSQKHGDKNIFVHHTNATDASNVEMVFNDCSAIILQRNLNMSGLS